MNIVGEDVVQIVDAYLADPVLKIVVAAAAAFAIGVAVGQRYCLAYDNIVDIVREYVM